jgi:glycerate-2-kinase
MANAQTSADINARRTALSLIESALEAVNPRNLMERSLKLRKNTLHVQNFSFPLQNYDKIFVVGGGKACGGMAEAIEDILGSQITSGIVNIPKGTRKRYSLKTIDLNEANHPIPDSDGESGVQRMIDLVTNVNEKTLIITLLSGGGSALLPIPQQGITLKDKQQVTDTLLKCGATIEEVNVVRKHISKIKGGRLTTISYPATNLCLILSDVVGDSLTSIASGPTVPDPSTFAEAVDILRHYNAWNNTPIAVRNYLKGGLEGVNPESPKPNDPRFSKSTNVIIGNNQIALQSALMKAKELNLNSLILSSHIEGEARFVGRIFAAIAKEMAQYGNPISVPGLILAGGETTVTVKGSGKGGRNQELALEAALHLTNLNGVVLVALGTDGTDGPTDMAGAIVDGTTSLRCVMKGIDIQQHLQNNDSYPVFKELGDHIHTGSTGTNVNDLILIVSLANHEGSGSIADVRTM